MQDVILYVHVPFCSSKCHFCSWVSPIPTTELVKAKHRFGEYATAVIDEIRRTGSRLGRAAVRPKLAYFGGGTPSLLDAGDLAAILRELFRYFPKDDSFLDTTIEMSPDTVTPQKLDILRAAGFNRISFGVQSFNETRARTIGRAHSPLRAIEAFEQARRAGWDDINIDVMIGFPEETETEFVDNVKTALMLEPDHLSIYVYKKCNGTVMARMIDSGKLIPCPKPVVLDRYHRASALLDQAGYSEYMFQLFGRPGKRCNIDYHYFHCHYDYLGFGQGAHSLASGKSYAHSQTLTHYLRQPGHNESVQAADSGTLLETKLFEMLHTEEGFNFQQFTDRLRTTPDEARERSPRFRRAYDCFVENGEVERTATGLRFGSRRAQVEWLSLPPYWLDLTAAPVAAPASLLSISSAV
jgi:oxygen-independent coproporphyrinogen-3 oxidase